MDLIRNMAQKLFGKKNDAIEACLIKRIEEIEGRVPSNEEVSRYAMRVVYPDGNEDFRWKGETICQVDRIKDGLGWVVSAV